MNEKIDKIKHIMIETIHKCLRCNKIAYQTDDSVFKCSDDKCGFKWETINCGK
jgi:hypothetical protein